MKWLTSYNKDNMIPILIDTSDVAAEFALTKPEVDAMISYTVKGITAAYARAWDNQAKRALHSTRWLYRSSIVVGEQGPFTGYVMLVNKLPNMIEQGASPFDIKAGFAKSEKAKQKKGGGWYLTVPFRFATPGALGESEVFSNVMPQEVYAAVRNNTTRQTSLGGARRSGQPLSVSQIPTDFQIPRTRAMIETKHRVFEEYKHKHSIYEGIQKASKKYQNATQGQYVSFRRVSDNSDKNSWIHRGFEAHNLAEKALGAMNIPFEVDRLVDNFLSKLGF